MRTNSHSMDSFFVCHLLFVKTLSSLSYTIAASLRKSSHLPVRLFKTNSPLLAFCCNRVGKTKNFSANSFQEHLSLVVKSPRPAELICRRPSDAPCGIGSVCHRTRFCASVLIMACDVSGSEERHPEDGTWQGTFVACNYHTRFTFLCWSLGFLHKPKISFKLRYTASSCYSMLWLSAELSDCHECSDLDLLLVLCSRAGYRSTAQWHLVTPGWQRIVARLQCWSVNCASSFFTIFFISAISAFHAWCLQALSMPSVASDSVYFQESCLEGCIDTSCTD